MYRVSVSITTNVHTDDSIGESVPLYHSNRYHHITLIGTTVSLESVPTFILVLSIKLNRLSLH